MERNHRLCLRITEWQSVLEKQNPRIDERNPKLQKLPETNGHYFSSRRLFKEMKGQSFSYLCLQFDEGTLNHWIRSDSVNDAMSVSRLRNLRIMAQKCWQHWNEGKRRKRRPKRRALVICVIFIMHERSIGTYDEIDCSSRTQMRHSFCLNTRNTDNFMFESM